ncbi:hypothetical protein HBE96_21900 [Clostridium sp. P21]|uniref:Uncharacterized protein n=1 Tax=Clostridium muellerianum TaxID=2716538 RepID=A0A7Y0EKU1_9CLOT|nr:hypothetical protein [Clostridium muellerianum]NMM65241.1 hypothetical protein [Clostridium muellerianum]
MALKKISPKEQELYKKSEKSRAEKIKKEMEEKNMMEFENKEIIRKEEDDIEQDELNLTAAPLDNCGKKCKNKVIENVMEKDKSNNKHDSFFDSEELSGTNTPINLEIEIQPESKIDEGSYRFYVKDLSIEKEVMTKYGVKNKLVIDYHITCARDGEDLTYDLKQKYNISNSSKSGFYQVYRDLTSQPPSGKINLRNLLGIKGSCVVKHVLLDNGDVFPKIVNINAEIYKES